MLKNSKYKLILKYLGPAFIISVAYIDPGNFATNISGGSKFNYGLLWVILWSNIIAIFLQYLSAKLGIATDCSLPELCGKTFKKNTNMILWIFAELAIIATNLAEFLGATLGFYLLFNMPMLYACILTAIITFFIVYMEKYGQRIIEIIIACLILVISIAYGIELFLARPEWREVAFHTLIPSLPNKEAILIAVGMLGATVMPHVIYLHSNLVQCRNNDIEISKKRFHLKMERIDIIIAMNIAFFINAAMVVVSASVFYHHGIIVNTIEQAHKSLEQLLGSLSSTAFGVALLASGLSSSSVGTMSGAKITNGFIKLNIPTNIKRIITMVPAVIIIIIGVNPMKALILSQVVLSFTLPLAIIPMLVLTKQNNIMGVFTNKIITNIIGYIITTVIISLNIILLISNLIN